MKKLVIFAVSFLALNTFAATYTGRFTVKGNHCTPNSGSNSLEIYSANGKFLALGGGSVPTDDGQGGCSAYNAIVDCANTNSSAEIKYDHLGDGFFYKTPGLYVTSFKCLN